MKSPRKTPGEKLCSNVLTAGNLSFVIGLSNATAPRMPDDLLSHITAAPTDAIDGATPLTPKRACGCLITISLLAVNPNSCGFQLPSGSSSLKVCPSAADSTSS